MKILSFQVLTSHSIVVYTLVSLSVELSFFRLLRTHSRTSTIEVHLKDSHRVKSAGKLECV